MSGANILEKRNFNTNTRGQRCEAEELLCTQPGGPLIGERSAEPAGRWADPRVSGMGRMCTEWGSRQV